MLQDYFSHSTSDQERRLLAVQAALEIVKASVGSPTSYTGGKAFADLKAATEGVGSLADAIQDALESNDDE
ncbi:hypothetical protein NMD73_03770 [Edwardsiella tarda]|uniref:hypothetical protein n=1 Tax=Edwardsiella tarda TaxID=636 RepID=UPI00351C1718